MIEYEVARLVAFGGLCGAAFGAALYAVLEFVRERAERRRWREGDGEWPTVTKLRRRA